MCMVTGNTAVEVFVLMCDYRDAVILFLPSGMSAGFRGFHVTGGGKNNSCAPLCIVMHA